MDALDEHYIRLVKGQYIWRVIILPVQHMRLPLLRLLDGKWSHAARNSSSRYWSLLQYVWSNLSG